MNWLSLRAAMQWVHREAPQKAMICDLALRHVETALADLARHGHHFELVEGFEHPDEWPRTVYHLNQPPRIVRCQADLDELGLGWYASPWDAQLAEGYEAQYEGKGGVPRPAKPLMTIEGVEVDDLMPSDWIQRVKAEFLQRKELRNGHG